jgi:hypothetical protein
MNSFMLLHFYIHLVKRKRLYLIVDVVELAYKLSTN